MLRLDQQVCFPLYAATNLLQRLYRPLLAPLELTYSQYLVMLVLWEREPAGANVTVGDLGHCLRLDNGTLTPLLKRMEQAGHITRKRDPKDGRRVLVTLTAAGTALHERARGAGPAGAPARDRSRGHDRPARLGTGSGARAEREGGKRMTSINDIPVKLIDATTKILAPLSHNTKAMPKTPRLHILSFLP